MYYGDDGCNIKRVNWRTGQLSKVSNHAQDLGFTDAVAVAGPVLLSSTYDLDTGEGGVNLFLEQPESARPKYIATLQGNSKQ